MFSILENKELHPCLICWFFLPILKWEWVVEFMIPIIFLPQKELGKYNMGRIWRTWAMLSKLNKFIFISQTRWDRITVLMLPRNRTVYCILTWFSNYNFKEFICKRSLLYEEHGGIGRLVCGKTSAFEIICQSYSKSPKMSSPEFFLTVL